MKVDTERRRETSESGASRRRAEARLFSGSKLARVLGKLGVDFHAFVTEYDQQGSRGEEAHLSDAERAAVQKFLAHGKISELATELACSIATAHARVTRFALDGRRSA